MTASQQHWTGSKAGGLTFGGQSRNFACGVLERLDRPATVILDSGRKYPASPIAAAEESSNEIIDGEDRGSEEE
jgi:hypothetical protein